MVDGPDVVVVVSRRFHFYEERPSIQEKRNKNLFIFFVFFSRITSGRGND